MTDAAPRAYICPLSFQIMKKLVINVVGSTYEKVMIEQWLQKHNKDPLTNQRLPNKQLIDNRALKDAIDDWRDNYYLVEKQKKEKQTEEETNTPAAENSPTRGDLAVEGSFAIGTNHTNHGTHDSSSITRRKRRRQRR